MSDQMQDSISALTGFNDSGFEREEITAGFISYRNKFKKQDYLESKVFKMPNRATLSRIKN